MNNMELKYRRANVEDIRDIVALLINDDLGKSRECLNQQLDPRYLDAFETINQDPNQYLMVVELGNIMVGTCHCMLMPSLTFIGSTRLQIEAVRVHFEYRGQGIGEKMLSKAIEYGKQNGASIIQLSTNKQRPEAIRFYQRLGFKPTHEGMKLFLD